MAAKHKRPAPGTSSTVKATVLYIDTDQSGVVYHAHYLRWFEAGRCNYMKRRGKPYREIERSGLLLPLVEAHVDYLKPALYDDEIEVTAWVGDLGRAQVRFEYLITRDGEPLVRGYTRHAFVGVHGKPVRIPEDLKAALESAETAP